MADSFSSVGRKYPFIRLVLPLLVGLSLGEPLSGCASSVVLLPLLFAGGVITLAVGLWSLYQKAQISYSSSSIVFTLLLYIFLLLFGLWRSVATWESVRHDWCPDVRTYHAVLVSSPKTGERTISVDALCLNHKWEVSDKSKSVRLYVQKDSLASMLRVGDAITFDVVMRTPSNDFNGGAFDYARYLSVKGFSGQTYVKSSVWKKVGDTEVRQLPMMLQWRIGALQWRERIIRNFHETGLDGEALALFSALTLGEKSQLHQEVKSLYAEVGVSHVLALSGMHLSFLVAVFSFLLLRFCVRRWTKVVGVFVVLALVWGYAFVAGLPASLVRAAIMYSLMLSGSLFGRQGFSLNSLGVSAVLMLSFQPLLLYDVGFQLSFLAMLGILTVYPMFASHPIMQWRYTKWAMQSLLVSFSAQLFTVPLVAYVFGMFAPYSALATLLVTPLTALLIYLMPVLILVMMTGVFVAPVVFMIECLVNLQNTVLQFFAALPFSVVKVHCSLPLLFVTYILLFVILSKRWMSLATWIKCTLVLMIVWWLVLMCSF